MFFGVWFMAKCYYVALSEANRKILAELLRMEAIDGYWASGSLYVFKAREPPAYDVVYEAVSRAFSYFNEWQKSSYARAFMTYIETVC